MTISKRMLLPLVALLMAGVGLAMYAGLLLGQDLASLEATVAVQPVAAATPAASPGASCELVPVDAAAEEASAHHRDERDSERGGRGDTIEQGDFATNSGTISGSQFSDGGFGDIGQQWWNVTVNGHVTTVNVTENGTANVVVGDQSYEVPPLESPTPTTIPDPPPSSTTTTTTAPSTTTTTTTAPPGP